MYIEIYYLVMMLSNRMFIQNAVNKTNFCQSFNIFQLAVKSKILFMLNRTSSQVFQKFCWQTKTKMTRLMEKITWTQTEDFTKWNWTLSLIWSESTDGLITTGKHPLKLVTSYFSVCGVGLFKSQHFDDVFSRYKQGL